MLSPVKILIQYDIFRSQQWSTSKIVSFFVANVVPTAIFKFFDFYQIPSLLFSHLYQPLYQIQISK
jgi:hypothetical protein